MPWFRKKKEEKPAEPAPPQQQPTPQPLAQPKEPAPKPERTVERPRPWWEVPMPPPLPPPPTAAPAKRDLNSVVELAGKRTAGQERALLDEVEEIIQGQRVAGKREGVWYEGELVHLPSEGRAIVVGDIHSRRACLVDILEKTRFVERAQSGERLYMVFLGDYIDRPRWAHVDMQDQMEIRPQGIEVVDIVLELTRSFPENVVLLMGNHERGDSEPHEFPSEVDKVYPNSGLYERYVCV